TGFAGEIEADLTVPGHPFLTTPCAFTETLVKAIEDVSGRKPELSTSGGTSDARFITKVAPVVEFGLIGKTIHQVNEYAEISDIKALSEIYKCLLMRYFGS
ncbi:MAG TPA: M20/M25/M40 family metallo-hydrolase, partial [Hellea balneolensis]|nr:M20/M25/M40 family metallo-hydrolase [Hellea balneolensis]